MAIKFNANNKEVKARTSKPGKLCSWTLVIQIILTISLGLIGLAPFVSGAFGVFLFLLIGALSIFITVLTAGTIWINDGIRGFFGNAFEFTRKMMESAEVIYKSVKPHIIAIAIPLFVASLVGFVYNLIYMLKKGGNKGRFITSCIFLTIAIINLVFAFITYLVIKF